MTATTQRTVPPAFRSFGGARRPDVKHHSARTGDLLVRPESKFVYRDAAGVEWVTDNYVMARTSLFGRRPRTTDVDWWTAATNLSTVVVEMHPTVLAETRLALVDEPVRPVRLADQVEPAMLVLSAGSVEVALRRSLWDGWVRTGLCPALTTSDRPTGHRVAWLDQDGDLLGIIAVRRAWDRPATRPEVVA